MGASLVPGLPKMYLTPSALSTSMSARLPVMRTMALPPVSRRTKLIPFEVFSQSTRGPKAVGWSVARLV